MLKSKPLKYLIGGKIVVVISDDVYVRVKQKKIKPLLWFDLHVLLLYTNDDFPTSMMCCT